MSSHSPYIPVSPVIRIVEAFNGDETLYVGETVLAFLFGDDGTVRALTSQGLASRDCGYLFPDAHVELFEDVFETLATAAEEHRRRETERKERRGAKKLNDG